MSRGMEVLVIVPSFVLKIAAAVAYVEAIFSTASLTELIFGTTPCAIFLIDGIIAVKSSFSFTILCVVKVIALAVESNLVELHCCTVEVFDDFDSFPLVRRVSCLLSLNLWV